MNLGAFHFWFIFGVIGQFVFLSRFLVQWYYSEKSKKSVIPDAFWYLSTIGAFILLLYAIHRHDPVFIVGQSLGTLVYARNIYFIHKKD